MKEKIIILISVVILIGIGVLAWIKFYNYQPVINSFNDCVKYGYPVLQTMPPQCKTSDGKVFVPEDWREKLKNSLKIEDLKIGEGPEVKTGDQLVVHYSGKLENGQIFDSSYQRHQPFEFKLGANQVIPGWDLGIIGMKVGGKRKLTIAPELAYGNQRVGTIPPNSTLIFEVELLAIK